MAVKKREDVDQKFLCALNRAFETFGFTIDHVELPPVVIKPDFQFIKIESVVIPQKSKPKKKK